MENYIVITKAEADALAGVKRNDSYLGTATTSDGRLVIDAESVGDFTEFAGRDIVPLDFNDFPEIQLKK